MRQCSPATCNLVRKCSPGTCSPVECDARVELQHGAPVQTCVSTKLQQYRVTGHRSLLAYGQGGPVVPDLQVEYHRPEGVQDEGVDLFTDITVQQTAGCNITVQQTTGCNITVQQTAGCNITVQQTAGRIN